MIGRNPVLNKKVDEFNGPNGNIHSNIDIANVLNNFFSEIGQFLYANNNTPDQGSYRNYLRIINNVNFLFTFTAVTNDNISTLFSNLQDTVQSWDEIPLFVLKNIIKCLPPIKTYICKKSLTNGIFLSELIVYSEDLVQN